MLKLHVALAVPEGDGVTVRRLMPVHELHHFDPFVLWDHFDIEGGGFPPHPHRGFEAITYLFSGRMHHKDSLGNEGTVAAGGAQRFTAGRGITHSEFPDGHTAGIQLWINLPRRLKSIAPDYQQAKSMHVESIGEAIIRHIVSEQGPVHLHTGVEYLDVELPAGTEWQRRIPDGWRGIVYAVEGSLALAGHAIEAGTAVIFEGEPAVRIETESEARLMWCIGRPHGEPIRQHDPFVD